MVRLFTGTWCRVTRIKSVHDVTGIRLVRDVTGVQPWMDLTGSSRAWLMWRPCRNEDIDLGDAVNLFSAGDRIFGWKS